MGTHPIFESDFDCLTDKQKLAHMDVTLEFCGGAETHANGQKFLLLTRGGDDNTVRDVFKKIRSENLLTDVENLIESEDSVKPGVLVLINDADWDLFDGANYVLGRKDRITFISTLHGG